MESREQVTKRHLKNIIRLGLEMVISTVFYLCFIIPIMNVNLFGGLFLAAILFWLTINSFEADVRDSEAELLEGLRKTFY